MCHAPAPDVHRWGSVLYSVFCVLWRGRCARTAVCVLLWRPLVATECGRGGGARPRVVRGRLPVTGRPNADTLHHGPPPAYAHGREAVGGAEAWPQVHPGVVRGARAAAGL